MRLGLDESAVIKHTAQRTDHVRVTRGRLSVSVRVESRYLVALGRGVNVIGPESHALEFVRVRVARPIVTPQYEFGGPRRQANRKYDSEVIRTQWIQPND